MSTAFLQYMDQYLDEYKQKTPYSGLLRVTYKDAIIYQRCDGYANPYTKTPVTEKSRFNFYSLSKPFCAIGLMKLIDQGKASLDDHPGKYIPEAASFHPDVTVYHMLHHTSGMADYSQHKKYADLCSCNTKLNMRLIVSELSEYPVQFLPGTSTQYANINFTLSALMIENITGLSYAEYMQKEVFDPLGMKNAVIDSPGLEISDRVIGMDVVDGILTPVGNNISWMLGGGDILGTVNDAYCLNHAIKEHLILSEARWKDIFTTSPINTFGCGCSVTEWHGRKQISHSGGHTGFRTLHIQLPEEDFDIILLANCGSADPRGVFQEAIYKAYFS